MEVEFCFQMPPEHSGQRGGHSSRIWTNIVHVGCSSTCYLLTPNLGVALSPFNSLDFFVNPCGNEKIFKKIPSHLILEDCV